MSECLIIESKSKVRQSRSKAIVSKVSTSSSTPAVSSDVAELKDMVRALILDKKNQTPAPAPVKAVEQSCVTCGGGHSYQNCPATDGNIYRDNIQEYVSQAAAVNYNQGNASYRPQMVANQIRPPVEWPLGYAMHQAVPKCMVASFHDMFIENMEVIHGDFSISVILSLLPFLLDNNASRCEDTNLCLKLGKVPLFGSGSIVLGNKILIRDEVDWAKVVVIANCLIPLPGKGRFRVAPDWDLPLNKCDACDFAVGARSLGQISPVDFAYAKNLIVVIRVKKASRKILAQTTLSRLVKSPSNELEKKGNYGNIPLKDTWDGYLSWCDNAPWFAILKLTMRGFGVLGFSQEASEKSDDELFRQESLILLWAFHHSMINVDIIRKSTGKVEIRKGKSNNIRDGFKEAQLLSMAGIRALKSLTEETQERRAEDLALSINRSLLQVLFPAVRHVWFLLVALFLLLVVVPAGSIVPAASSSIVPPFLI
ncbi:hypothetical protein Tco_0967933 [Tanacetum coccineum]